MGFTLIEVMLAMTLLSIMVVLLFSSLRICAESWDKGEAKIAQVNEKAVAYQFFKRHLSSARPLKDDFSDDKVSFSFQGSEHQLQFVSHFSMSAERKGLQIFTVDFEGDDNNNITVALKPFYPLADEQQWQQEKEILLENVTTFELAYFGKDKNAKEERWLNQWQDRHVLPRLVKIKIELADQSDWPDMVFDMKMAGTRRMGIKGNAENTTNIFGAVL